MADTQTVPTVADLFRRAQAMRKENPQTAYRDIAKQIVREFSGGEFPPTYNLTIPEQDRARRKKIGRPGCPWFCAAFNRKIGPASRRASFCRSNKLRTTNASPAPKETATTGTIDRRVFAAPLKKAWANGCLKNWLSWRRRMRRSDDVSILRQWKSPTYERTIH